jgi:hypothetical protein
MTLSLWTFQLLGSWRTIQPNNFSTGLTYCTIHIIQAWLWLIMYTNWENSFGNLTIYVQYEHKIGSLLNLLKYVQVQLQFVEIIVLVFSMIIEKITLPKWSINTKWINKNTFSQTFYGMHIILCTNITNIHTPSELMYMYIGLDSRTVGAHTYINRVNVRTAHASSFQSLRFRTHGFYFFRSFTGK